MNSDQAKFILQARRPNGADDHTPSMREALDQAARDPRLGEWLARQERFDASVADALRRVTPPPDLRALILAGAAAQTPPRSERAWWQRPTWLALAASLALAATLGTLAWVRFAPFSTTLAHSSETIPADVASLREFALIESVGRHAGAVHADEVGALGRWLETPGQRLTVGLPFDFAGLQAVGCRVLNFSGREVLEVCFKRDRMYHLYIARRNDFAPAGAGGQGGSAEVAAATSPELRVKNGLAVASWARGELIHIMVAHGDESAFDALL